jgi:FtsH-binding integral membrane protein
MLRFDFTTKLQEANAMFGHLDKRRAWTIFWHSLKLWTLYSAGLWALMTLPFTIFDQMGKSFTDAFRMKDTGSYIVWMAISASLGILLGAALGALSVIRDHLATGWQADARNRGVVAYTVSASTTLLILLVVSAVVPSTVVTLFLTTAGTMLLASVLACRHLLARLDKPTRDEVRRVRADF